MDFNVHLAQLVVKMCKWGGPHCTFYGELLKLLSLLIIPWNSVNICFTIVSLTNLRCFLNCQGFICPICMQAWTNQEELLQHWHSTHDIRITQVCNSFTNTFFFLHSLFFNYRLLNIIYLRKYAYTFNCEFGGIISKVEKALL